MGLCFLCKRRHYFEKSTTLIELIDIIDLEINYLEIPDSDNNESDNNTLKAKSKAHANKGISSTYDIKEYSLIVKLKMNLSNLNNYLKSQSDTNHNKQRVQIIIEVKNILLQYFQWKSEQSPDDIIINKDLLEQINTDINAFIQKGKK